MAHLTGTHVYSFVKCPRLVALELHGDHAKKRARTPAEELMLRRGREHEEQVVAPLGYAVPQHAPRDFEAGARATRELLASGVVGVHQGVLQGERRLGIPDLLRREDGNSDLGGFHYVVGDVKSSRRPRADQLLQVAFYARLLGELQGRAPAYGYLLLRDGHEERFTLAEYADVVDEVEAAVTALLDPERARAERPFLGMACSGCPWSNHCLDELRARADLSLLQRMTRGLRDTLESAGIADCHAAAALPVEAIARRTHLEAALLRRIKRAAEAWLANEPLPEPRGRQNPLPEHVLVSVVFDAFEERALCFAALDPATGEAWSVEPASRDDEAAAFLGLVAKIPAHLALAHHGPTLPRWFAEATKQRGGAHTLERRFLDLAPRLRGAATYPRPIFELADYVRASLGREPGRSGQAVHEGAAGIAARGREELADLAALVGRLMR